MVYFFNQAQIKESMSLFLKGSFSCIISQRYIITLLFSNKNLLGLLQRIIRGIQKEMDIAQYMYFIFLVRLLENLRKIQESFLRPLKTGQHYSHA